MAFLKRNNFTVIFTGSLVDFLKTTEGSSLTMNTLIDMASQARHLCFLLLLCLYSFHNIYQIPFHFLFHFLFPCHDPRRKQWPLL